MRKVLAGTRQNIEYLQHNGFLKTIGGGKAINEKVITDSKCTYDGSESCERQIQTHVRGSYTGMNKIEELTNC
jgi:hypothetical protein